MKIAIVIHTSTGHTLQFAQSIREAVSSKGHEVDILGLRVVGAVSPAFVPGGNKYYIKSPPDISEYDAVLFGAPVWAFSASPVLIRYLVEDVKTLKGKKALSFVTYMLAGANRALRKMNEELEASGADVLESEKLVYVFKADANKMRAAVERICNKLGV